jgi:ornithine cyclodeaminase
MRVVTAAELARIFTFPDLVEALRLGFRRGAVTPVRHHHSIAIGDEPAATLLLMPAWHDMAGESPEGRAYLGVKVVTVHPGNAARGRPSVSGTYLLMDGRTGEPLAAIDGQALTLWRTAAASALAATYLARDDAARLLIVGAGALAPYLIAAHASVRPVSEVRVWNRTLAGAERVAGDLGGRAFSIEPVADLEAAVREADIVSCATLASQPLVRGEWLRAGSHLDLVGAFTPQMRESDDAAVRRARLYVDTREGALKEAGDILQPLENGVIDRADILGDLFDLCRGAAPGRRSAGEITLFKSVGTALEDLVAATLAFDRLS